MALMHKGQRLHPLSFLFIVGDNLRSLIVPAILVLFAARSGGSSWQLWALWLAVPYTLFSLYRWATFRYAYEPNELVIRTGILFRNERHILYSRIQNIETLQNPLHRLFKVVEVRVQTAGGQEPEAKIQVLATDAADEMRRRVLEAKRAAGLAPAFQPVATPKPKSGLDAQLEQALGEAAPAPAAGQSADASPAVDPALDPDSGRTILKLTPRDLLVFGLVDNRGLLVAAAAFGLIWEANIFGIEGFSDRGIWQWVQNTFGVVRLEDGIALANILSAIGVLLMFVVLVRMLSVGWAFFKLYDFTLKLTPAELKTSCGLLTRVRATVPRHRIQVLSISESPLQRVFKRVGLLVETAGGDQGASEASQWLAPILPRDQAGSVLSEVDAGIDFEAVEWQPAHPRAWFRMFRRYFWWSLVATALAVWPWGPWGLLTAVPLLVLAWFASRGRAKRIGYAFHGDQVYMRDGWLWRHTTVARLGKIQTASITRSPWDRRWDMAHVAADTAGGGAYGIKVTRLQLSYLQFDSAQSMYDRLAVAAAHTEFSW